MKYETIHSTSTSSIHSLTLPKIGFGTWKIGGESSADPTTDSASIAALRSALEVGCTHFDTAEYYSGGHATTFFSITWYSSTIAHDATHSELYAQYRAAHPGEPINLEVSKRIGAPQSEIDYLSTLDGTHCDVDHDGDCDWDDYQNRNW